MEAVADREDSITIAKRNVMRRNPILEVDSYKLSHFPLYPAGVSGMFSYIEARTKNDIIVPFGLQMWIKKHLLTPITMTDIDEAEDFATRHGEPFNRAGWEKVVKKYNGFIPVTIRSVPEGTKVPSGNVLVTIQCLDAELFWLVSYIETSILRGFWYTSTIATNDLKNWRAIKRYSALSNDDDSLVQFTLHDFGGRGVTTREQAEVGGAAHLVYFAGSDTIDGIRAANFYYGANGGPAGNMSAFSVVATEHSIQTSYGVMNQKEYLEKVIDTYAKPGAIISIVLDGYDTIREARVLCEDLKDKIIASGARIVMRPDSGDPLELVPQLLRMIERAFGSTINKKGYKVLNNVGVIWGDGIDYDSMNEIMEKVTSEGYALCNVVFGSGGGLLQKVNRDTYAWAQKASAIRVGGKWMPIKKDPITDPGKKSKAGRLTLAKSMMDGAYWTMDIDQGFDSEFVDVMQTVYENGKLLVETTLDEIRARATA